MNEEGLAISLLEAGMLFQRSAVALAAVIITGTLALNRIIELIECDDPRVCLMAAKEVLDRAFGKVKAEEDAPGGKSNKAVTINIMRFSDGTKSTLQLEAETVSDEAVELS